MMSVGRHSASAHPVDASGVLGLTSEEAADRHVALGPNELPNPGRRTILRIAFEVLKEPMFLLLVACGSLYVLLGDPGEAAMLLGFVGVIIGITVVQERRTERALDALKDLSLPKAVVVRDGRRRCIRTSEVVVGDIVVVSEGNRVAADGVLREGSSVSIDESALTGESVAVRKRPVRDEDVAAGAPGGDDTPFLFAGAMVVRGQGLMEVTSIGSNTEMGRIGQALASLKGGRSALQDETRRLVRVVAVAAGVLSLGVTLVYGLTRGLWVEGLLSGLATAMALLPEEFPVVLTVFLALGAFRLSRAGVLTRNMAAIEALGTTTLLCTDKTGTLTQNRMVVRALWAPDTTPRVLDDVPRALDEELHAVVEFALLASPAEPTEPMELAIHALANATLQHTEHLHPGWSLRREYPLSPELLAMTRAWEQGDGALVRQVAAKGSPEAIFDLCHLDAARLAPLAAVVEGLAEQGLRVLGVAHADHHGEDLPAEQHDFAFRFDGLVAFEDPLRPEVPAAIADCHAAGVRILMITGDYPTTALSIARRAGLPTAPPLTGAECADLTDVELTARLGSTFVAARIKPQDKLRIVQCLQAAGHTVAMTGDGVNDAPALTAADIGVAMGQRGTEVARESADLVLIDDDFGSLVTAMAHGRRIFSNLRKSMAYIVAIHVPLAGLSILPVVFGWPAAVLPVHIVLLELIIDPACSLVFEAEPAEVDNMRRPPRPRDLAMLDGRTLLVASLQGVAVLIVTMGVFAWALRSQTDDGARSMAFLTLMVSNVGLILVNRSRSHSALELLGTWNPVFPWVVGGALLMALGVTFLPGLNGLLHFVAVPAPSAALALVLGLVTWVAADGVKRALP
ncbi:MAG: Ca2+-transporting ATPase [Myxococcota bacterium]|jgi:Ca2+-transporting ATPase